MNIDDDYRKENKEMKDFHEIIDLQKKSAEKDDDVRSLAKAVDRAHPFADRLNKSMDQEIVNMSKEIRNKPSLNKDILQAHDMTAEEFVKMAKGEIEKL